MRFFFKKMGHFKKCKHFSFPYNIGCEASPTKKKKHKSLIRTVCDLNYIPSLLEMLLLCAIGKRTAYGFEMT